MVGNEFLLAWNRGEFGEVSPGGSTGPMWLPSEVDSLTTGRDKLDAEIARLAPAQSSGGHRWTYRVCKQCSMRLPLADRKSDVCRDCQ